MKLNRFSKYFIFSKASMMSAVSYRFNILIWVVGSILSMIVTALLWFSIFSYSDNNLIGGFNYPQMLMYIIAAQSAAYILSADSFHTLVWDIRNGDIGIKLTKPINYRVQLAFSSFGSSLFSLTFIALPFIAIGLAVSVFGFGLAFPAWWQILLFFISAILGGMINDCIQFMFALVTFKTQAGLGIFLVMEATISFLSGAIIPLSIFPAWASTILSYTPFPSLASAPANIFLGQIAGVQVLVVFAIQLAWIIGLNIICILLYKLMVKRVVVFGG